MGKIRSNSACLLVGDSGTGKSSLIATLAEKVYKDHGKKTLYYLCDGGGYGTQVEVLIEKGIIWLWKLRTRQEAFETCARASQGYWPKDWNPETGESLPGGKLLAPITTTYKMYCVSCGTLASKQKLKSNIKKLKCPGMGCKEFLELSSKNVRIEEETIRTKGLEDVGAIAYDGLTSMQQWIMDDLARRTAEGDLKGEATGLGGVVVSGDYSAGGNNRAHYGFAQNLAERWILDSTAVPNLVAPPVWTALEERGQTSDTKMAIYGPKLAGGAKTSSAPQWVGNCLGLEIVPDTKGRNIHRLHLEEWRQADKVPHLCKNRSLPGMLPPYLEDVYDENDKIETFKNFSLGKFFDLLDNALETAKIKLDKDFPVTPGFPIGSIGEEDEEETIVNPTLQKIETIPIKSTLPQVGVRGKQK